MDFSTTYPTDTFDAYDTFDTYEDSFDTYEDSMTTGSELAPASCCCGPTAGGDDIVDTTPWELPPEPEHLPPSGSDEAPPASPGPAYDPTGMAPPPPPPPSGDPIGNPAGYPLSPEQQAAVEATTTGQSFLPPALPETQSVIPSGQPGGPGTSPEVDMFPAPSSFVIGGQPPTEYTIVDPMTQSVYEPPTSIVIGPPTNPDPTVSSLMDVYGVAVSQGDIMSQILLDRTLQSMHATTAIWTI